MAKRSFVYTVIVCVALIIMHTVFVFLSGSFVTLFVQIIRPGIYALLTLGMFLYIGRNTRTVKKAYQANAVALIALIMYVSMIVFMSYIFGGARNSMTVGIIPILRSVWTAGVPLVLGEIVRFRLIKATSENHRIFVVVALSVVYAFAGLDALRILLLTPDPDILNFIFASVLLALTTSAVVSFTAIQGSLFSVLLISFVYNLGGTFSPILPLFDRLVWSLVISGMLFVVGIMHYYMTDEASRTQRKKVAQMAKYSRRNPLAHMVYLSVIGLTAAFFLQVFPIYPVVILTASMTGAHDRGSMVIMRRIPVDEAFMRVQEGDVLHYNFRNVEFVHRVVGFTYTDDGVRKYVTQGDANEFPDPSPVPQEDVLGTPMFTIPFIGYPNIIFQAMTGGFF